MTGTSPKLSRRWVLPVGAAAATIGFAWLVWVWIRPRPSLVRAASLAAGHRFDEAEAEVRWLLREQPQRTESHLLMAQVILERSKAQPPPGERPDPKAAHDALDHLRQIRTTNRAVAAQALLARGNAELRLGRLDAAEASWTEALRLDPTIPEAGWSLLELYYLEGRGEEARRLALRLHEVEPDPRDRVQLLLELVRQDAQPPAPGSLVAWFEPIVRQNPGEIRASLALGLAHIHVGEVDRGLELLGRVVEAHPSRPEAWDAWLTGLDDAGQIETLAKVVDRLPAALAGSPRSARHNARVDQERGDWKAAAAGYRRALAAEPHDQRLEYRLSRALRNVGETAEADRLERLHRDYTAAVGEARSLYDQANAEKTLGARPHPVLYRRIAELRERMGLREEAIAWYRLALRDRDDPAVLEAIERLVGSGNRAQGS